MTRRRESWENTDLPEEIILTPADLQRGEKQIHILRFRQMNLDADMALTQMI